MIEVRQATAFKEWFKRLRDSEAKARILARLDRVALGNFGDVKPVGEGVSELRIAYGPGYRVYFVQHGSTLVILLCGGDKRTQDQGHRQGQEVGPGGVNPMPLETSRFDPAEYLDSPEIIAAYISAALEEGDPALVAVALGNVARARGISQIAQDAGLSRESLHRALSGEGSSEFETILRTMRALGLKLSAEPLETTA